MSKNSRTILVTGGAGFIGSHLVDALLKRNDQVIVLDNFNKLGDPAGNRRNASEHSKHSNYKMIEGDIRDKGKLKDCFSDRTIDAVVHLAAMSGVRPSITEAPLYLDTNVTGTQLLLDTMLEHGCKHLVFSSSSAVYGNHKQEQFLETDQITQPLSPYAASKAAGELLAYCAHHTQGLNAICFRFFTVFGPRQRDGVAIQKFMRLIDAGKPIEIYGDGTSQRDYVYVTDVVSGIIAAIDLKHPGYEILNLARSQPIKLIDMVQQLELALGKKAAIVHTPVRPEEIPYTFANIDKARKILGYAPSVSFESAVQQLVAWYKDNKILAH